MTTKTNYSILALSAKGLVVMISCVIAAQSAKAGAIYQLLLTEGNNNTSVPPGVDVTFEQRWNEPTIWQLVSGVDDGGDGIPNGTDSIIVDRTALANNATRLSNEGMPDHEVAKVTGTGAPGNDIVLKQSSNVTIGDLEVLPSANAFTIFEERDQPLTINGVISGSGPLEIIRNAGFSNGVQRPDPITGEDEIILITGGSPNTFTGELFLGNSNGGGEPTYFVADKVGAFGEASLLTLASINAGSSFAELQFTANTVGGEGAIDDDATQVFIGSKGLFNVDAGVNEFIGSGNLFIDLAGTGTFSAVPNGVYDSSAPWIIGQGLVTVGAPIPEPTTLSLVACCGLGLLALSRRGRTNN